MMILWLVLFSSLFPIQDKVSWKPDLDDTWYYQLENYENLFLKIDSGTMPKRDIYVVDMDAIDEQQIKKLQNSGIKVVAYFSAGTLEAWRNDASDFPMSVLGEQMDSFPDERYLKISADIVLQLMKARIRKAAKKGFDGVEPDNVDIAFYSPAKLGFKIKESQQIVFNQELAKEAKKNNLAIGLKNNREQIVSLVDYFNWSTNESIFSSTNSKHERKLPRVFIQKNKPVLAIEYQQYTGTGISICDSAKVYKYFPLLKNDTNQVDEFEILCP